MLPILEKPSPPILFPFSRNFHFADSLRFNIALLPTLAILLASIPTARIRGGCLFRLPNLTGSGRMVAHPFPTPKIRVGEGWPVNQALLCKVLSAFLRYHSAEE